MGAAVALAPALRDVALGLLARLAPQAAEPAAELSLLQRAAARLPPGEPAALIAASRPADDAERALVLLADHYRLGASERIALALALLVEREPLAGRAVAWLQAPIGGARPSLGLLAEALGELAPLAAGTAVRVGLLELDGETLPLPERAPRLPGELALALLGVLPPLSGARPLPPPEVPPAGAEARAALLACGSARRLLIRASAPADAEAAAAAVARALGRHALLLAEPLPRCLGPLAVLEGLLPVIALDLAPGERRRPTEPAGHDGPLVLLAGPDGSVPDEGLLEWVLAPPVAAERARVWRQRLGDAGLVRRLATDHVQGPARIAAVAARAGLRAALEGRDGPDAGDLRAAAEETARSLLEGLAQPVPAIVDEAAFVVPATLRSELELLLARCRARDCLAPDLGPAIAARASQGVRALLTGPSGTGKTMAASWLAGRLGLPLFRVDLAEVTSKYIGETEKNLARLLARAEAAEVVLLFDEADSVFGRRTEVREANDRFANAQTNYLLQRIETYGGIVVLTANSRARLDPAFSRRLDLVLDFPLPGPEERRALWQAHLGSSHTLAPAALNRLAAACDLTGGQIRNVVLLAAAGARVDGGRIGEEALVTALAVEYRKQGRSVPHAALAGS